MPQSDALKTFRRYGWLCRVRPMAAAAFIADLLVPDRRTVIASAGGLKLFIDPLNELGQSLLKNREYEPATAAAIRKHLHSGDSFVDIGANEGFFSILAGLIVGAQGAVAAVEPQARLKEIIEANMRLNGLTNVRIFQRAMGGEEGETASINLYPSFNTGASSLAFSYRFSRKREEVKIMSPATLLQTLGRKQIDLVKIDVEGFEHRVVQSISPLLRDGRIKVLMVDYHRHILEAQGVDPTSIEQTIIRSGMITERPPDTDLSGYRLYRR